MKASYRFSVEIASASLKWIVGAVLPSLPTPGTSSFVELMAVLRPFGVDPQHVTLATPTGKLSDVMFSVGVKNGAIRIQYTYSGIELVVEQLADEYLNVLRDLADAAFNCVQPSAWKAASRYEARYMAHLRLESGISGEILTARLAPVGTSGKLIPDAFAYRLVPNVNSIANDLRVVLAQSALLANGLWTDFTLSYPGSKEIGVVIDQARADIVDTLSEFGLELVERK